jgi:hypothetical protein
MVKSPPAGRRYPKHNRECSPRHDSTYRESQFSRSRSPHRN